MPRAWCLHSGAATQRLWEESWAARGIKPMTNDSLPSIQPSTVSVSEQEGREQSCSPSAQPGHENPLTGVDRTGLCCSERGLKSPMAAAVGGRRTTHACLCVCACACVCVHACVCTRMCVLQAPGSSFHLSKLSAGKRAHIYALQGHHLSPSTLHACTL